MTLEGNYTFAGIGAAEAKDRENEHRTGVPGSGSGLTLLLSAPVRFTTGLRVMNQGSHSALVALAHGQSSKTVTAELLAGISVSTTIYRGSLQFGSITPGSVTITEAGALADIVDDGAGVLHDIGVPANVRGTIDYTTGVIDILWGGAATEVVSIAYTHTDYTQFANAQTTVFSAANGNAPAGAYPETLALGFGRVVPGSVSLTDGVETFVDDGKGNMIETTATAVVQGTIDYATGVITLTGGSGVLADPTTATYSFNPFSTLLVAGGAHTGVPLLSDAIPELGSEAYADGVKGEASLGLLGVSRETGGTNLLTLWAHHVEEPYRVKEEYTAFPAGGASNDARIDQGW